MSLVSGQLANSQRRSSGQEETKNPEEDVQHCSQDSTPPKRVAHIVEERKYPVRLLVSALAVNQRSTLSEGNSIDHHRSDVVVSVVLDPFNFAFEMREGTNY